jgi:hypothetical protein
MTCHAMRAFTFFFLCLLCPLAVLSALCSLISCYPFYAICSLLSPLVMSVLYYPKPMSKLILLSAHSPRASHLSPLLSSPMQRPLTMPAPLCSFLSHQPSFAPLTPITSVNSHPLFLDGGDLCIRHVQEGHQRAPSRPPLHHHHGPGTDYSVLCSLCSLLSDLCSLLSAVLATPLYHHHGP